MDKNSDEILKKYQESSTDDDVWGMPSGRVQIKDGTFVFGDDEEPLGKSITGIRFISTKKLIKFPPYENKNESSEDKSEDGGEDKTKRKIQLRTSEVFSPNQVVKCYVTKECGVYASMKEEHKAKSVVVYYMVLLKSENGKITEPTLATFEIKGAALSGDRSLFDFENHVRESFGNVRDTVINISIQRETFDRDDGETVSYFKPAFSVVGEIKNVIKGEDFPSIASALEICASETASVTKRVLRGVEKAEKEMENSEIVGGDDMPTLNPKDLPF